MANNTYSLQFDGSTQYAKREAPTGVYGLSQITLETWFSINALPPSGGSGQGTLGIGCLMSLNTLAGPAEVVATLSVTNLGKLQGRIGTNGVESVIVGNTTLTTSSWYHASLTYNGSTLQLNLGTLTTPDVSDGSLAVSGTLNTPGSLYNTMYLGALGLQAETDVNRYFNGWIDEARIWNTAKSLATMNAQKRLKLNGNETNLISLYNANESSGTIVDDVAVGNNDLTLINGVMHSTNVPFTTYGGESGAFFSIF